MEQEDDGGFEVVTEDDLTRLETWQQDVTEEEPE